MISQIKAFILKSTIAFNNLRTRPKGLAWSDEYDGWATSSFTVWSDTTWTRLYVQDKYGRWQHVVSYGKKADMKTRSDQDSAEVAVPKESNETNLWAVSIVLTQDRPEAINVLNRLMLLRAVSREKAIEHGCVLALRDYPTHSVHCCCGIKTNEAASPKEHCSTAN